jgi:hypothetical protein
MRVPKMVQNGFKSAFCFWVTFQSIAKEKEKMLSSFHSSLQS